MAKFVPKEKLSKKAQKELNRRRRVTWDFSPVTKTVDSRKIYSRKRKVRNRDEYGPGFLFACLSGCQSFVQSLLVCELRWFLRKNSSSIRLFS